MAGKISKKRKKEISEIDKKYYLKNKEQRALSTRSLKYKYKAQWMKIISDRGLMDCTKCGYNKCFAALDYHHIIPKEKKFSIGQSLKRKPTEDRLSELDKVICLCSRCHRELHAGIWNF